MNLSSNITKIAQTWTMPTSLNKYDNMLWKNYIKSVNPSAGDKKIIDWVDQPNTAWDPAHPDSTFEKWMAQPNVKASFEAWKPKAEAEIAQKKDQADLAKQQAGEKQKDQDMQNLLRNYSTPEGPPKATDQFTRMTEVKQMADYLKNKGFTEQMIARFNPNLYKAMQNYGLLSGWGIDRNQLQTWQEQQYKQNTNNKPLGSGVTLNPATWFSGERRQQNRQKKLDDYYRQQYAKSKGKIITAYDGSLLKKMSQGIPPFRGPIGPDNPKSDDLGLSPDYNPRDDDTLGDIYKEHDSPESVDNISSFVLQQADREQMIAQLNKELKDPANFEVDIHDWDEIIDIVNNHLRETNQPEITKEEFDFASTKLNNPSTKLSAFDGSLLKKIGY